MEQLLKTISSLLDSLYFEVISPGFVLVAKGLDILIIQPLLFLHIPPVVQIMFIAFLTGMLSMAIRHLIGVEKKEAVFKATFTKKKDAQDDLKLISDWKSGKPLPRPSTTISTRTSTATWPNVLPGMAWCIYCRYFLVCSGWKMLWNRPDILFYLPENRFGVVGIYPQFVFLLTYCLVLFTYFRLRRKKRKISD